MKKLFLCTLTAMSLIFIGCDNESQLVDVPSTSQVTPRAHLGAFAFVSSNTSGQLGIFAVGAAIANPPSVGLDQRFLNLAYADADGVVYDENRDAIYQVDRTNSRVVALDSISARTNGESVAPNAMGPSTFINGREATMYNNKVVVADDVTPGRLASYHVNTDHISDYRWHDVGFEVWGIQATAKDLWAIEDVSSNVVFFRDYFKAKSGALSATAVVAIEGLVRTHGLHYDESADLMVLTDIGAASSATDGALIVITNFAAKFAAAGNGGTIGLADQIRIAGDMTELGNPVDVAVDGSAGAIFVAERAQQKFLVFAIPNTNCNCAPVYSTAFAGASAVTLDID
jgi:hypothetical protein